MHLPVRKPESKKKELTVNSDNLQFEIKKRKFRKEFSLFYFPIWHYKIFCVNVKYGIQYGFRVFYLIALQNEENYEREESCSA
ncbi:hypothetical protein F3F90_18145 [Bacteroides salyersiae]|uniref:Uncharacterized protein n=1 Tax=Bacteroides salyersiae TaxID=291644 RepID=A0A7J4XEA8_9BACE|nr:hypothetical protein F3F90_18145 [Bacteroides salyersiae]KAA3709561.1 hypothetical protein F3G09_12695 [Bacteroides salyersiae]KAA3711161.1 hypothetical protein F3G06_17170 [Bacteroides salyersiae]KAA3719923.1 hypothetical protein F3F99_17965 [Bacteroides salyersiae]KAA3722996.1 hypothetical protein F3F67_15280 [Bacteroides salyersiae]